MAADSRCAKLDAVLRLSQQAFCDSSSAVEGWRAVARKIFSALATHGDGDSAPRPATLAVCEHLAPALAAARRGPASIKRLAPAFEALAPQLAWSRRSGASAGEFYDGHANALLVGPRGLERRDDLMVGVSLVAPGVRYPDHHHPPEEIYLVLSAGEWRQTTGPWHEPGPGGVVHNPPHIVHAMRAGDTPLLALWFLWLGRE